MRVGIMIEGAMGLNWSRWKRLVQATEELGFDGIFRSDHFMANKPEFEDALEAYISLTWAADNTERIDLGTLVSPISFRDPRILAWQATAVNDLANGRLRLGLGAGWQEIEHDSFGFDLGTLDERFSRFEDGVQIVKKLAHSNDPVSHDGEHYQLKNAQLKPRYQAENSPAIVIGGNGPKRTLPLVAKYADEWNGLMLSNADFQKRNTLLDEMLEKEGRDKASVRRSQMVGTIFAKDQAALDADVDREKFDELLGRGAVIGTPNQMVDILGAKAEAGVEYVMLQWLDLDDFAGLELIANNVLPQIQNQI